MHRLTHGECVVEPRVGLVLGSGLGLLLVSVLGLVLRLHRLTHGQSIVDPGLVLELGSGLGFRARVRVKVCYALMASVWLSLG